MAVAFISYAIQMNPPLGKSYTCNGDLQSNDKENHKGCVNTAFGIIRYISVFIVIRDEQVRKLVGDFM